MSLLFIETAPLLSWKKIRRNFNETDWFPNLSLHVMLLTCFNIIKAKLSMIDSDNNASNLLILYWHLHFKADL